MSSPPDEWEIETLSETGPVRPENQDRMCSRRVGPVQIHVIADGMGGHKGGALAAQLTAEGLCHNLGRTALKSGIDSALRQAFVKTNREVYRRAHSDDPDIRGMGSTAVAFIIANQVVYVAHVGDSRAYLFRKGRLHRLTRDHTRAQKMIEAGILTPEQGRNHPDASILYRAIGSDPEIEVDIAKKIKMKPGDSFLLCTDGLSGYLSDEKIEKILRGKTAVRDIPKRLYKRALEKGSDDNITIQFLQYGIKPELHKSFAKFWYLTTVIILMAVVLVGIFIGYDTFQAYREVSLTAEYKEIQGLHNKAKREVEEIEYYLNSLQKEADKIAETKKEAIKEKEIASKKEIAAETKISEINLKIIESQSRVKETRKREKEFKEKLQKINSELKKLHERDKFSLIQSINRLLGRTQPAIK